MRFTVVMTKARPDGYKDKIEIVEDKNYCFGKKRPKGNYFVFMPRWGKSHRTKSLVDEYKYWKSVGFQVAEIR